MRLKLLGTLLCGLLLGGATSWAGQSDAEADANYELVVRDLIPQLGADPVSARDAATKLARLGKRSIPVLIDLLQSSLRTAALARPAQAPGTATLNADPRSEARLKLAAQVAYYSTLSLTQNRHSEAGPPMLKLLNDTKAPMELRLLALEAASLEKMKEAGQKLIALAQDKEQPEFRRKAFMRLTVLPEFWVDAEQVFVETLSDPDDELRLHAAKLCYFAKVFHSGAERLTAIAAQDSNTDVRIQAMLALGQMRTRTSIPTLYTVAQSENEADRIRQLALRTINHITTYGFKDYVALKRWWEKTGEKEYEAVLAAAKLAKEAEALRAKNPLPPGPPQPPVQLGPPTAETPGASSPSPAPELPPQPRPETQATPLPRP